jgi:hypothetical protein
MSLTSWIPSREQLILQTMLQQASWFVATATKNLDYLSVPKYSLSDLLKTPNRLDDV